MGIFDPRIIESLFVVFMAVMCGLTLRITMTLIGQKWINTFHHTLSYILLPVITLVITKVIAGNLALSLGMIGALSIVRFRAAIKEPEEIAYLFLCIAIGLGLGANYTLVTVTGFAIILALTIVVNVFSKKNVDHEEMFCTISLNKKFVLEELLSVLKKHSNYLFLRDFDITSEFSQVGLLINFKNSNNILSLTEELNRTYPGVSIKFLNKQALS